MDDLLEEVRQSNQLLKQLITVIQDSAKPKLELGFVDRPVPKIVSIGNKNGGLWYFWLNDLNTHEDISPSRILQGYVESILIRQATRKGTEKPKLNIRLNCGDKIFVIESGIDSLFSSSALRDLDSLSDDQIRGVLGFGVKQGDAKDVVTIFAEIYSGGTTVYVPAEKGAKVDCAAIVARLSDRLESLGIVSDGSDSDNSSNTSEFQPAPIALESKKIILPAKPVPKSSVLSQPQPEPPSKVSFDPLSGQGSLVAESNSAVDHVRSSLKSATTLRNFSEIRQYLKSCSAELGETITDVLTQNIDAAYEKQFPKATMDGLIPLIKQLKEQLEWDSSQFNAFLTGLYPECPTTAHLTLNQIVRLASTLKTRAEYEETSESKTLSTIDW